MSPREPGQALAGAALTTEYNAGEVAVVRRDSGSWCHVDESTPGHVCQKKKREYAVYRHKENVDLLLVLRIV